MSNAGKLFTYVCPDGHSAVTVCLDEGATPFMLECLAEGCYQDAWSTFYAPTIESPTHEWYRPGPEERKGLSPEAIDHVDRGGLMIRRISDGKG